VCACVFERVCVCVRVCVCTGLAAGVVYVAIGITGVVFLLSIVLLHREGILKYFAWGYGITFVIMGGLTLVCVCVCV